MVRKAQIFFVSFAVVMLLVHTIIPHHHHKIIACFSSSDDHCEYCHHDTKKQEHHSGNNETEHGENCTLQQMLTIPRNNVKPITEYENLANHLQDIAIDILTIDYVNIQFVNLSYFDFSPTSKYTFLINSSSGLRAPPLV